MTRVLYLPSPGVAEERVVSSLDETLTLLAAGDGQLAGFKVGTHHQRVTSEVNYGSFPALIERIDPVSRNSIDLTDEDVRSGVLAHTGHHGD